MKCPFYGCEDQEDNPHFDEPAAHLIITVGVLGHTHIHGPFDNMFMLKKMADALIFQIRQHGLDYQLPDNPKGERDGEQGDVESAQN